MASRHSMLALAVLLAASGCRTAGVSQLSRPDPVAPPPTLGATEMIREHNRAARLVESLEAHPSITVSSTEWSGGVQGLLALERPRNFSLALNVSLQGKVADIGSNDDEYWFWVKDRSRNNREYYYCEYDESGKSPLATTLQPELIIEALGLREIPEDEAAESVARPGKTPGTLALIHRPSKARGETFTRVTIFTTSTGRIKEHQILSGDGSDGRLLARAVVNKYQPFTLPSTEGGTGEVIDLPADLRIEWLQEKFKLDVVLSDVHVNTSFTDARRQALFVEPKPKGYTRVNLAERMGVATSASAGATTIRESRTPPPSGADVERLEPSPIKADRTTQRSREPLPLAADLSATSIEPEPFVGARPPQAPSSEYSTALDSGAGRRGRWNPIGRE